HGVLRRETQPVYKERHSEYRAPAACEAERETDEGSEYEAGYRHRGSFTSAPFDRVSGRCPGAVSAVHIDDVVSGALEHAGGDRSALAPEAVDDHRLRPFHSVHFVKELSYESVHCSWYVSFL